MKSDRWLTERIIKESLHKQDVSYMRGLMHQGKTDEEILASIRRKMFSNSKGMQAYIRHEKVRALMVKLTAGIHWVCLLPVIKSWITEKETLIKWRESEHAEKIQKKIRELRNKLIDVEYKKMKFDCANGEGLPEKVMEMIEKAAEELLVKIEEEERARSSMQQSGRFVYAPVLAAAGGQGEKETPVPGAKPEQRHLRLSRRQERHPAGWACPDTIVNSPGKEGQNETLEATIMNAYRVPARTKRPVPVFPDTSRENVPAVS